MPDSQTDTPMRPSLTTRIAISLVAGLACGLFFGEYTSWIKWVGDAFVGLLQMAVLPYVAVSLVANVGRLSLRSSLQLLRTSILVLCLMWGIGLGALVIMTLAFPVWDTGSFFSSHFTDEPPAPDWLELFIPSNPFRSLADNAIPAVVVFCIGLGIALMSLPHKNKLLEPLEVLADALAGLNKLVVNLTPIGMFAIVAHTAGTLDPMQFSLIQGYLLTYGVSALILSMVVLPAIVSAITPLGYWQVLRASRDPLVAAFVIGNTFVVLPLVIEAIRRIEATQEQPRAADGRQPEYLVPLAYPFPDIGRIVGLVFLPFAAWFFGTVIDPEMYASLLGVGFLGSFGKPVITIPLLLDIAELPSDIFNLFLASGVVAARFGDLMKAMHLLAFSMITISILNGSAKFLPWRLLSRFLFAAALLLVSAGLIRGYLTLGFQDLYSKEKLITHREMLFPESSSVSNVQVKILGESTPNPLPIRDGQSRVQRIQERGKIRVGYDPSKMPFAYFRAGTSELIGFDIQMAYSLADDLEVDIEFVPIQRGQLHQQLSQDHFDVAMSGLEGSVRRAALLPSIDSYMEVTLAVVVPDHEKANFRTLDQILNRPDLKLAVIKRSYFAEQAPKVLPPGTEVVELESASEYFNDRYREVQGLVMSAEKGSAWTLRHPQFTVTNPLEGRVRVPLYYMTADDNEFETFLQNWLTLQRANGTFQRLYDYWILGLDEQSQTQRWCILRDVLQWGS